MGGKKVICEDAHTQWIRTTKQCRRYLPSIQYTILKVSYRLLPLIVHPNNVEYSFNHQVEYIVTQLLNSIMLCTMSFSLICLSISSNPLLYASASAAALAALLALFSNKLSLRAAKIVCCLSSTPCSQYPKLAPAPAKTGYAHSDSLFKNGRISRPSCHARTARPDPQRLALVQND